MENKQNAFYLFLSLTRGNWRNSLYIECKNTCCKECKGFLMISDTEGVPMLYPVSVFENKTGEVIDKNECVSVISIEAFNAVYDRWLIWNITDKKACSIPQLIEKMPYII